MFNFERWIQEQGFVQTVLNHDNEYLIQDDISAQYIERVYEWKRGDLFCLIFVRTNGKIAVVGCRKMNRRVANRYCYIVDIIVPKSKTMARILMEFTSLDILIK